MSPAVPEQALGDACHAVFAHGRLVLTTTDSHGLTSNRIFLNRAVFQALVEYGERAFARPSEIA